MAQERATAVVDVDGKQAQQEINKLKNRAAELRSEISSMRKMDAVDPKKLNQAEKELKKVNSQMKQLKKEAFNIDKVMKNLDGSSFNDLKKAERELTKQTRKLRRDQEGYQEAVNKLKKVKGALKQHKQDIGAVSSTWGKIKTEALGVFGGNLLTKGVSMVSNGIRSYIQGSMEFSQALSKTRQLLQVNGEEAENLTQKALVLAKTFDKDYNDVLKSASVLQHQFGISGEEAFELIDEGFKKGADVNGEFLDQLKEYPTFFDEAGLSAENMVAIITQTEGQGIFSDKGVDAIKEATIRLREMTPVTKEALEGIGISANQLEKDLQSGSITYFDAIQMVSGKLNEVEEQSPAVGAAVADIFGGAGEDAGLKYLQSLKDIKTNLDDVESNLDEGTEAQLRLNEQWNTFITGIHKGDGVIGRFVRGAIKALGDMLEDLNDAIKSSAQIFDEQSTELAKSLTDMDQLTNEQIEEYKFKRKELNAFDKRQFEAGKITKEEYDKRILETEKTFQDNIKNARENTLKKWHDHYASNVEINEKKIADLKKQGRFEEAAELAEKYATDVKALEMLTAEKEKAAEQQKTINMQATQDEKELAAEHAKEVAKANETIRQMIQNNHKQLIQDNIERMNFEREQEIAKIEETIANEELKNKAIAIVNQKFDQKIKDEKLKREEADYNEQQKKFQEQLAKEAEMLQIEHEQKQLILEEQFVNSQITQAEYNNQKLLLQLEYQQQQKELYEAAGEDVVKRELEIAKTKLQIKRKANEDDKKANNDMLKANQAFYSEMGNLFGAFGEIIGAQGEHTSDFQKGLTVAQIGFDTAAAISSLTKMSEANPANASTAGLAGVAQFVAGLARIATNMAKATKILTATKSPQYASGLYPIIGADDGILYNAAISSGKTGLYSKPTYTPGFGLYGEKGPEIVIDGPTTKNIQINYPHLLAAIDHARVPQYASGTPAGIADNSDMLNMMASMIQSNQSLMSLLSSGAVKAHVVYTDIEDASAEISEIKNEVSA